jgi:predicted ester cyclase
MQPTNEEIYRRLIEEGFNQGRVEVVEELVSPNAIEHQRGSLDGQEGVVKTIRYLRSAFPDFKLSIDAMVVDGDTVWARQHGGGTDLGGFAGQPPTGRQVLIDVFDVCRFENGKMVEHWGVPDQLGMMMALGHISPPARRTPAEV